MDKSPDAFRTISEVAELLETPAHVLRFWESRFPQIKPVKRAGGRRYYRPADVALLSGIRKLLHDEGMTIRGVQKILRDQGVRHVASLSGAPSDPDIDPLIAAIDLPVHPLDHDESKVVALTEWRSAVETGETPEALRQALRPALQPALNVEPAAEALPPAAAPKVEVEADAEVEAPRQWSLFSPDDMPITPVAPDPRMPHMPPAEPAPEVEGSEDPAPLDIFALPIDDAASEPAAVESQPEETASEAEPLVAADSPISDTAPEGIAVQAPESGIESEKPDQPPESPPESPAPTRPWIAPDLRAMPRLQDAAARAALGALRARALDLHARLQALNGPRRG